MDIWHFWILVWETFYIFWCFVNYNATKQFLIAACASFPISAIFLSHLTWCWVSWHRAGQRSLNCSMLHGVSQINMVIFIINRVTRKDSSGRKAWATKKREREKRKRKEKTQECISTMCKWCGKGLWNLNWALNFSGCKALHEWKP